MNARSMPVRPGLPPPAEAARPLLEIGRLRKYYHLHPDLLGRPRSIVHAVDDVSLTIARGETLSIVGESGCGKSTLGKVVVKLQSATSGTIRLDGEPVEGLRGRALKAFRKRVQIVFQDPYSSLNPRLTVFDSLAEPLRNFGEARRRTALEARIAELLGQVGLPAEAARRYPHEFSGGQRQRIAIARALAPRPDLIVCDEAVSALDVSVKAQVINLLGDIQKRTGLALLFISHDLAIVEHLTHRVAVMYLGRVVELADRRALFGDPRHPYTRALISAVPVPDPSAEKRRVVLKGDVPSPMRPPPGCRFHTRCPVAAERCRSEVPELRAVAAGHTVACHFDLPPPSPMSAEAGRRTMSPGAVEVRVSTGRLQGRIESDVRAFRGIPYAAPPVGPRRFRHAAPPEPWSGIRPALEFAAAAPQPPDAGLFPGDPNAMPPTPTDEDCLYLNVWAPAADGPHPVLVWLHGGSQIVGGTARPVYDGAVFARRGIVCVTVGFRLGALGNLELGELLGPAYAESGNCGLSDQVAALRWVHGNIAAFGGDPRRVTLGGESAGAKNVAALMASPAARSLFRAAVIQSGGGETVHGAEAAGLVARRFVALSGHAAAELPMLPVAEILATQQRLLDEGGRRFPFRAVHGMALLPQPPLDAVANAGGACHALLIGTTRDETGPLIDDAALLAGWQPDRLAHRTPEEMAEIERRAADALGSGSDAERRRRLIVAEAYLVPALRLADAHAAAGGPTWMYRFHLELPSGPLAGCAPHTVELSPTWNSAGPYDALPGRPAAAIHEAVVRFVKTHDAGWPRYETDRRVTALIGDRIVPAEHPDRAVLDLFGGVASA